MAARSPTSESSITTHLPVKQRSNSGQTAVKKRSAGPPEPKTARALVAGRVPGRARRAPSKGGGLTTFGAPGAESGQKCGETPVQRAKYSLNTGQALLVKQRLVKYRPSKYWSNTGQKLVKNLSGGRPTRWAASW